MGELRQEPLELLHRHGLGTKSEATADPAPMLLLNSGSVRFGSPKASSLLLEEISFHIYKRPRHILVLLAFAVLDNFGYRQLNTLWRMAAVFQHLRRGVRARLARRRQECPA